MAKKTTASKKKPAVAKKATTTAKKKPSTAKKAVTKSTKKTPSAKTKSAVANNIVPSNSVDPMNVDLISPRFVEGLIQTANDMLTEWENATENNLTLLQRRRKTGPGNSNYGFVDKVSDIAMVNPEYATFINVDDLKNAIRNVEACRDLFAVLQALARAVSNTMLVYSTVAFDLALDYYSQVKVRADRGDPKAIELYRILNTRFRRPRKTPHAETNKQIERDVHDILTHKKDGEVIVKGKAPKLVRGGVEVIDDVHKGKAEIKGKFDEQVEN